MVERFTLVLIALIAAIVVSTKAAALPRPVNVARIIGTPVPPPVIPAWIFGGGNFYGGQQAGASPCPSAGCSFYDVDPGAEADRHLFAGVINAAELADPALKTNCPGIGSGGTNVSNCNPYKYVNMAVLICDTRLSIDAFDYLDNSNESGFLHAYAPAPDSPMPAPRDRLQLPGGRCLAAVSSPIARSAFPTSPDDSKFQTWLLRHAWTARSLPTPYGISEDNYAVVGYECDLSHEYGDRACNIRGKSAAPTAHDWETALGSFEKNAQRNCPTTCFAFIGNGLTPGGGSDTGPCSNVAGGHCYVTGFGGVVDDMDALDNLCAASDSGGHLRGIEAEDVVFLKGNSTIGTPTYADTQTIVYMINTMSHLVNDTSGGCKHTVAIDVEAGGGSFYPLDNYPRGTVAGGYQTRLEATALRFLVPNPATLVPDRMQPLYFTAGGTDNQWTPFSDRCHTAKPYCEIPYFFEETLVPQGPEVSVGAFTWNGSKQSVGDGCPSNPGDKGGAVDLVATCVDSFADGAAVFRQEYRHMYIDGVDHGPAAILLNTSGTSLPISPRWFCARCDRITAFSKRLTLSGGELSSVKYPQRVEPIPLECTQAAYCTGKNTAAGNTSAFSARSPGSIGAHSGVTLLGW